MKNRAKLLNTAKQEKAQLNVAEFLAGAGKKKSETKTKQKHFPKHTRRCKLTSNDECNHNAVKKIWGKREEETVHAQRAMIWGSGLIFFINRVE